MDKKTKETIEEQCILLFNNNEKGKTANEVDISQEQFTKWWSEWKLGDFEKIKFYLMEIVKRKPSSTTLDKIIKKFTCYCDSGKKSFNEHFDDTFILKIAAP